MKVIIVGAGIAGLSAAIGLRRTGHDVLILERSSMAHEVGAAIHVPPNAARVLQTWGFDITRARLTEALKGAFVHGDTLKPIAEMKYEKMEEKYGAKLYFAHRVDLHTELKMLAIGAEGVGKPAELLLKQTVVDYDAKTGFVTLASGVTIAGDLIIGADGIHSEAVKHVNKHATPPIPKGMSCFRWLSSTEEMLEDPETALLMEDHVGKVRYYVANGKRLIWYPCRQNTVQNYVLIVPDEGLDSRESWTNDVDPEIMADQLTSFHPAIKAAARKAKDVKLWSLCYREPLPRLHRHRLVVIGDAAHPMLPLQGQAGAQAVEDGAALSAVFSNSTKTAGMTVSERLELFEKIRKNRASVIQILSNAGQDEPQKVREAALPYMPVGTEPPTNPREYEMHNFGYDIFEACDSEISKLAIKTPVVIHSIEVA